MNWKILLGIMVCFAVMMSASYTMLIPFLPLYLTDELNVGPEAVNLWAGVLFSISFAISAFVSPLWGKLSDRTGKKPMILRASILLALCYFLGGLVQSATQLLMMRILQGFASGLWPACLTLLTAYIPKNKLGIAMGMMQSANITGGIVGPLLGGTLATFFGMRNSFFIGGALLTTITLVTIFFIKEPPKETASADQSAVRIKNRDLIFNPNIFVLLAAAGLTNMVILQLQPIMTIYVKQLEGTDPGNLMFLSGLVFSLGGFAGALASPFWGRTGQKVGFHKTMITAFLAAGFLMALQALPSQLWLFALMQFIVGLGFSGIFPSANSILVLVTPPAARGASFGLFFAAQQVGGAIGPLLGGILGTFLPLQFVFLFSGCVLFCIGLTLLFKAPEGIKLKVNELSTRNSKSTSYIKDLKYQLARKLAEKEEQDEK
ncbi:MAG: MFS transporter [Succinivibrio sp.]|nr:MFS transporter [Succinivibrio sp.]